MEVGLIRSYILHFLGEKNVFEKGGCKLKILINHQI